MPSQKSSALQPKRARGVARVESLLETAGRVFAERGYDKATMTEIAERSSTAIGSLYRFFPTKEALGEMLLRRYMDRSTEVLDELALRADGLDAAALTESLIEATAGSTSDELRAAMLAVLESRGDAREIRRTFRARRRRQIAAILRNANPALDAARAQDRAVILLYLLKGQDALAHEEPSAGRRFVAELKRVIAQYVAEALRER